MNPKCPSCKGRSRKLSVMDVTFKNGESQQMQVYQCINPNCEMTVPYPEEGTKWQTEFVISEGKKILVRPSADEFA